MSCKNPFYLIYNFNTRNRIKQLLDKRHETNLCHNQRDLTASVRFSTHGPKLQTHRPIPHTGSGHSLHKTWG